MPRTEQGSQKQNQTSVLLTAPDAQHNYNGIQLPCQKTKGRNHSWDETKYINTQVDT